MNDVQQVTSLYKRMYEAMINKDTQALAQMHDSLFVMTHLTGKRQSAQEYISSIADGTLDYSSAEHVDINVRVIGANAWIIGKSRVTASLFGTERREWDIVLKLCLVKSGEEWKFTDCRAGIFE